MKRKSRPQDIIEDPAGAFGDKVEFIGRGQVVLISDKEPTIGRVQTVKDKWFRKFRAIWYRSFADPRRTIIRKIAGRGNELIHRPEKIDLYLNSSSDYSITDHTGKRYSIEEARRLWEGGDYAFRANMAFMSLVTRDWDLEALKKYYRDLDAVKGVKSPETGQ